jgi:predicted enzyme related to lactoylglutathione lyase
MIDEVRSIAVVVTDPKKSIEFYTQKLGFELRNNNEHWITVAPKGSRTLLHLCQSEKPEPGNTGVWLHVDNLEKSYDELSKKGVKFTKAPKDEGWGKYAMVSDPDGNEFWLLE